MILWTYVTKYKPVFWDWYWSWHFIVVNSKWFCIRKMFLQRNCLRINIHESMHVNLKSVVTMKLLQLCIFIHNFWSFCLFIFITFWCFTCNNLQHILPPIYDNNYFYYSIRFLIRILDAFNHLASNSLCFGVISRLPFVLFPIRDINYFSTVKMSSLSLISTTLFDFLDLTIVLNHVIVDGSWTRQGNWRFTRVIIYYVCSRMTQQLPKKWQLGIGDNRYKNLGIRWQICSSHFLFSFAVGKQNKEKIKFPLFYCNVQL